MATNRTRENEAPVEEYIHAIVGEHKRSDCQSLLELMCEITGLPPKMWGTSIVGFGSYHYQYTSGHSGDAPLAAFSSRATAIVLYLSLTATERVEWLSQSGKQKAGKGCIYIKSMKDIDEKILRKMIVASVGGHPR